MAGTSPRTYREGRDTRLSGTHYFTDFTWTKFTLYMTAALYVIAASFAALTEPFMDLECTEPGVRLEFANPAFDGTQCRYIRYFMLMGFTREECSFARRLVASCLLGGFIGWERRQADRPAGIRTMSLVSLGSCLFTINSSFAFLNGPMSWDASRVSAAIPSGVGFLGAGLIFKKEETNEAGERTHVVHGLTTAASLWLSAAVGIACGGDLYMPASLGVAIMMLLLRFGPRGNDDGDDDDDEKDNDDVADEEEKGDTFESQRKLQGWGQPQPTNHNYQSIRQQDAQGEQSESGSINSVRAVDKMSSRRRKPALASIV